MDKPWSLLRLIVMKKNFLSMGLISGLLVMVCTACSSGDRIEGMNVTEREAIEIAENAVIENGFSITEMEANASHAENEWIVEYSLRDENVLGGGMRVIVDSETGGVNQVLFTQ